MSEARSLSYVGPGLLQSINRDGIVVSGLSPWEWSADAQE